MTRLSLLALTLVALAACGGSKAAKTAAPEASPETAGSPLPPDSHTQIEQLEAEIDAASKELKLEPSPMPSPRPATPYYKAPETDPNCLPAKTEKCSTSCKLSGSICRNAEKICNLANELPNDTKATQKCARANTICEAAHAKCCGCQ